MKVRQIQVAAGRTVNLKNEFYSNAKPFIQLVADLDDGEDPIEAAKALHQRVENLIEDQCDELVAFVMARTQQRNRLMKREKEKQQGNGEKKPETVTS